MAYGYRRRVGYRRRRRRVVRRPQYTSLGSAMHLARRAAQGVYYLKGLVNSELLKHDSSLSTYTDLSNAGVIFHLTGISQGDTQSTRTGNSIFVRSVDIRLFFKTVHSHNLVRVALVADSQQLGDTLPSYTDIYDSSGSTIAPLSHLNSGTVGRFRILYSRTFVLDDGEYANKAVKIFKKLRHHVRYNGTISTDIQKGGLYLVMVSNDGTNMPQYVMDYRVSYHDN